MVASSRRGCCSFMSLASFRRLLCTRPDDSDSLASMDEPLPQNIPTHAAASILNTATPASMRQVLNRTHTLDSSKTALDVSHVHVRVQAIDRLETVLPPATTPNDSMEASIPPQTALPKPVYPFLSSYNTDIAYPSRAERTTPHDNMEASLPPLTSLHKPLYPYLSSHNTETAYASLTKQAGKTRGRVTKKRKTVLRDSLATNRLRFGNYSKVWSDA